jgi:hypothetical protein
MTRTDQVSYTRHYSPGKVVKADMMHDGLIIPSHIDMTAQDH